MSFAAATKCDFCGKIEKIIGGSRGSVPPKWGTIYCSIKLSGFNKGDMSDKQREQYEARMNLFKARCPTQHLCPECLDLVERSASLLRLECKQETEGK